MEGKKEAASKVGEEKSRGSGVLEAKWKTWFKEERVINIVSADFNGEGVSLGLRYLAMH